MTASEQHKVELLMEHGWMYLTFMIGIYSRMIAGCQVSRAPRSEMASAETAMAEPPTASAGGN